MLTVLCGERDFARRRQLFPYTFFYQCCVAFREKSCAEEEDEPVAQGSSSTNVAGCHEQLRLNTQAQSVCLWLCGC